MGGGGGQPKQPAVVPQQSYKQEVGRQDLSGDSGKKALGARWLQQRKATPVSAGGFGGTKPTLG